MSAQWKVAFSGEPASAEAAIYQMFTPSVVQVVSYAHNEEVFNALRAGKIDFAVTPIENAVGGRTQAFNELLRNSNSIFIVGECTLQIKYCLVANPGASIKDIKTVMSHPDLLSQCQQFLKRHSWAQTTSHDSTASAAHLRDSKSLDTAVVTSDLAAQRYGLTVLEDGIADHGLNYIRFVVLSTQPGIPHANTKSKTSLVFALKEESGILFKALSVFALRNINLCKIESWIQNKNRMMLMFEDAVSQSDSHVVSLTKELKERFLAFSQSNKVNDSENQTLFYLEIEAPLSDVHVQRALQHLAEISPLIRILGSYPENGVLTDQSKDQLIVPTRVKQQKLKVGIIGYGRFGQFLAKHFLTDGNDVFVINVKQNEDLTTIASNNGLQPNVTYFQGREHVQQFINSAVDVLVFAISVISFAEVLQIFVPFLKSQLIVDVLSVKTHPKELLLAHAPATCDVLCTHPMFGPDSGKYSWVGLSFIYEKIRVHDFHRCSRFLSFWEDKGCRMVQMECEEHDKLASGTQFITHLTGRMLSVLNLEPTPIDTKGYKDLLNLVGNTCRDSFDLFFALYKHNSFSRHQVRLLEQALNTVKAQLYDREDKSSTPKEQNGIIFNPRVANLVESKTSRITDIATQMREQGVDVLSFSVGEPDFAPPQPAIDAAIAAVQGGLTKYTPLMGTTALRKAIVSYLKREKGLNYSTENILCSNGGKQCILQAIMAICRPGDEVIVPAPYWVSYTEIVKLAGAIPVVIPTTTSTNFLVTPQQLEAAITLNTRVFILCNPSNPTGAVYSKDQQEKLAEVFRRHPHVFILADELYEKITYDIDHVSFASLDGMFSRTLTVNGLSKAFAMTGFRLGYLAAPKPIVDACAKIQSHNTTCPCSISQAAGVAALEKSEKTYFSDAINGFRQKRDFVLEQLKLAGINAPVPGGAFYVFFSVAHLLNSTIQSSEELCVYLLQNYKIALVPGEAFGTDQHIRISYAVSLKQLEEGMKRLVAGLLSLKQ